MAFDLEEIKARSAGKTARFCPLLGEWCTAGWTPTMGMNPSPEGAPATIGTPKFGACAAWQPLRLHDASKDEVVNLRVCSEYDQAPGLLAEIAKEAAQAGASADKVADEVFSQHMTIVAVASDEVKLRLRQARPGMAKLPGFSRALQLEHKTGGGNGA